MLVMQAITISKIYFLQIKSWFSWFFLYSIFFPVGSIFFIRVLGNNSDPLRLVAGASVLSISIVSINATAYWIMTDRFQKRIQLITTMPIHQYIYFSGIIVVSVVQSVINVHVLLAVLKIFGFTFKYSFGVIGAILITSCLFSVFGILIGKGAKDASHGSLLMNLFGTGAVLICPIFYSISVLPEFIGKIVAFFPYTLAYRAFYHLFG
jgi:hypothetical protein